MIAAIEQKMVDRIKAAAGASNPLGYEIKTVEAYGNQFDDDVSEVVKSFPAALVGLVRVNIEDKGANELHRCVFTVSCAAKSLRNEKASRHGAAGAVGSLQMAKDMAALFSGHKLELDIGPIAPRAIFPYVNGRVSGEAVSVMVTELETYFTSPRGPDGSALDDFATFRADWLMPPIGEIESLPLPDGATKTTDTVELETQPPDEEPTP